jgi:DNA-binding NarL/FixJ family response regulator
MLARALIVDDHPIVRDAIATSLVALGAMDTVDGAFSFREAVEKLRQDAAYQLLVLDLSLVDMSGVSGVTYLREHFPNIPIVVFSASDSADTIARCFESGVHGFVSKLSSTQNFIDAINTVLAGGTYIPASAAHLLGFESWQSMPVEQAHEKVRIQFTPKQQKVFDLLMLGMPNKIIAKRLYLAEGTVKTHLHSIYQILRVSNRAQAILKSQQLEIRN